MEKEVLQIRRAQAVGRLVLDQRASLAINQLDETWRAGSDVKGLDAKVVADRLQALTAAYSAVLEAARSDLGMKARLG